MKRILKKQMKNKHMSQKSQEGVPDSNLRYFFSNVFLIIISVYKLSMEGGGGVRTLSAKITEEVVIL